MKTKAIKNLLVLVLVILVYPMVSGAVDKSKTKELVSMTYSGTFKDPNGTVSITIKKVPLVSLFFITSFTVTVDSPKQKCEINQWPYAMLDNWWSVNFATFSWDDENVTGTLGGLIRYMNQI